MSESAAKMAKASEPEKAVPVKQEARSQSPVLREGALEHFFDELLEDFDRGLRWPSRLRHRLEPLFGEAPRLSKMDVFETDDQVVVKAELPGVSKEDIEVVATGSTLTVKGEKKREEEVKRDDYHRSERRFGSVQRTIELPAEVKADKAVAKMADGVLEVRLPKTEAAKASSVKLQVQ